MKFNAHLTIHELEILSLESSGNRRESSFMVKIEWKGSEKMKFGFIQTRSKKDYTSKQPMQVNGIVRWDEGCNHTCKITRMNDRNYRSWAIDLEIQEFNQNQKGKNVIGNTRIDIVAYVAQVEENNNITEQKTVPFTNLSEKPVASQLSNQRVEGNRIQIPVRRAIGDQNTESVLNVELQLVELKTVRLVRAFTFCSSSCTKNWQMKMPKFLNPHVYPAAITDALSEDEDEPTSAFKYDSLHRVNSILNDQEGDKIENHTEKQDFQPKKSPERVKEQPSLVRLLSGKLSFKNTSQQKGEPLLNKASTEVGGDDIDNERFQDSSFVDTVKNKPGKSFRFDDKIFEVGVWEQTSVISRDGETELVTDILLASIDQRNEKVGGDGACSVLAVVIASWLHSNPNTMPLKCQLDELIHEGSLAWRKLCEDESLRTKFSNLHFDLETVLHSNMRPLLEDMSMVAFFSLDDMPDGCKDLQQDLPFDRTWNKIVETKERIYITSWNDHFFVLKIESDAIYLIDTLGERLSEGCDRAYILKFDKDSVVRQIPTRRISQDEGSSRCKKNETEVSNGSNGSNRDVTEDGELNQADNSSEAIICNGIQSCREYIKRFLAALPLKQLQDDLKKGPVDERILNRLVQIEFHDTSPFWNH